MFISLHVRVFCEQGNLDRRAWQRRVGCAPGEFIQRATVRYRLKFVRRIPGQRFQSHRYYHLHW